MIQAKMLEKAQRHSFLLTTEKEEARLTGGNKSTATDKKIAVEPKSVWSNGFFMLLFIVMEAGKQLSIYGAQYYNNTLPPIRPSLTVTLVEAMKLIVALALFFRDTNASHLPTLSLRFAVPAVIYGITNNLYFLALTFTTTPVWNILIQTRIIAVALMYRVVFSRSISTQKWCALAILMGGVMLSQIVPGIGFTVERFTLGLAAISVTLNAFVSLYTEYLFKFHTTTFYEQQVAMYFYGLIASATYYLSQDRSDHVIEWDASSIAWTLQLIGMVLNAGSGMVVAVIVKRIDNISKLFAVALALVLQGVASAVFFPDKFNLTLNFMISVCLIFYANYLYQKD